MDSKSLGAAVARTLRFLLDGTYDVYCLAYRECPALLSADLLRRADMFVLDLFRTYATGRRAEGVAVAQKIAVRGCSFLLISEGKGARELRSPIYWGPGCGDTLPERVSSLLAMEPDVLGELERLTHRFRTFLTVPATHS